MRTPSRTITQRHLAAICFTLMVMLFFASESHANPEDGIVTAGQATITTSINTVDIYQQSDRTVIDWRSFNIAPNERTEFHQPSANAIALNRVHSSQASVINGALKANGNVVIINQNGVAFGSQANVDVNGLVATSADVDNAQFMDHRAMTFDKQGAANAAIINDGNITAKDSGLVGFIAPHVQNNGVITARLGRVHLAAGDTTTLDFYGDGLLEVAMSDDAEKALVKNTGTINADGGTIALTAATGRKLLSSAIEVQGSLSAQSVGVNNGTITIAGLGKNTAPTSASSNVQIAGNIDASGIGSGTKGGTITITADNVMLASNTRITAKGDVGGGGIKIGGDFQGHGPLEKAHTVTVAHGAVIDVSATRQGHGGEAIIFANDTTDFNGTIHANAAGNQGNGGLVETSGKHTLKLDHAVVQAIGSQGGNAGSWLLDPADITITAATNANVTGVTPFAATATASQLSAATIVAALNGGTNVTVQTTNDGFAGNGDIFVNSAITTSGAGSLTLTAFRNIGVNANITLAGGALNLDASNGAVSGTGAINTGGGLVTITQANAGTLSGIISGAGGLSKAGAGALTLTAANTYTGATTVNDGTLQLGGAGTLGSGNYAGNIAIASGASLIDASSTSQILSGIISGAGNVTKNTSAASTLTLSGANTYTGGTNINAGTVNLGSAGALGSAGTISFGGGTLQHTASNTTDYSNRFSTAGAQVWSIDTNGQAVTYATALQGAASTLAKLGAGTLTLTGANNYTGNTTITAGTLLLGGAGTLGGGNYAGNIAISSGASLTDSSSANQILSGIISGAGSVTKNTSAASTLTLSGANTYTGGTNINAGTVSLGSAGALGPSGAISFAGGTLQHGASNTTDYSGRFSTGGGQPWSIDTNGQTVTYATLLQGAGSTLTKLGAGTLNLTGANSYTGTTTISAGTLQLGTAGSLGAGNYAGNIAIASGASLIDASSTSQILSGIISGAGSVTKNTSAASTLTLSGANTYTGGTTITAGTVSLGSAGALGSAGTISFAGGTLQHSASNTVDYSNRFSTAGTQPWRIDTNGQNVTYATALQGAGSSMTKLGTGILTLSGANTYTGVTTVSAGTLRAGSTSAFGNNSAATVTGTLDLNGFNNSIGSLAGAGTVTNGAVAAARLTAGGDNTSTTFSGSIQNGSGTTLFTKTGTGTQTLSGANTHTGTTTVSSGTLTLSGSLNVGGGTATTSVATGATLGGAGVITAATLQHSGAGTVNLTGNNLIGAVATTGTIGPFTLTNAQSVSLGAMTGSTISVTTNAANSNITVNGALSTTGAITLSSFRNIDVAQTITTTNAALTLRSNNAANAAGGAIRTSAAISTGGGAITMGGGTTAPTAATLAANGSITAAATGYAQGNATVPVGVQINAAVSAGGGNILINGQGENGTNNSHGVELTATGSISTTGAGLIRINGIAQGTAGNSNQLNGVALRSTVTSVNGAINITGTGGGGTGTNASGVLFSSSGGIARTTGTGAIVINGMAGTTSGAGQGVLINNLLGVNPTSTGAVTIYAQGGAGTSGSKQGFVIGTSSSLVANGGAIAITGLGGTASTANGNNGIAVAGALSNTGTGTITLTGTGGGAGTSTSNHGVVVTASAISGTGSGAIAITGNGGNLAGSGGTNHGVYSAVANGIGTSGTRAITITGTKGGQASSYGFITDVAQGVRNTGASGNITIASDTISLNLANNIVSVANILIGPRTAITMGVGSGAGTLSFTDTMIGYLTAATGYTFGNTTASDVTVNTALPFTSRALTFISNANLTLTNAFNGTGAFTTTAANGTTTFNGNVGTGTAVGAITMTGRDLILNQDMRSSGNISGVFSRDITLAAAKTVTTGATSALTLTAAGNSVTGTGNLTLNGNLSVGTGGLTLLSGVNGTRPSWTATATNLNRQGATFGTVSIQGFLDTFINRDINSSNTVTLLGFRDVTLNAANTVSAGGGNAISIRAANGNSANTGSLYLNGILRPGTGGLTLLSGQTAGVRPSWVANTTSLNPVGVTFGAVDIQGFNDITVNRLLNSTSTVSFSNNTRTILQNNVTSSGGAITFSNPVAIAEGASATVSATNQNITFASTVTDTAGGATETLTVNPGTATAAFGNTVNGVALSVTAGTATFASPLGATTALGNTTISATNNVSIANIRATALSIQTTGSGSQINLTGSLQTTGAGSALSVVANGSVAKTGTGDITSNNGPITLTAGTNLYLANSFNITSNGANINLTAPLGIVASAPIGITTGGGNLNVNNNLTLAANQSWNTGSGAMNFAGTINNVGAISNVEVLAIGGGGGGGPSIGGGGGAGGLLAFARTITAGTNVVTVGAGGTSATNGTATTIFGATAAGGGAGRNYADISGNAGGSGGGAGGSNSGLPVGGASSGNNLGAGNTASSAYITSGANGTGIYGNAGGSVTVARGGVTNTSGAGGGGAGAAGDSGPAASTTPRNGGAGISSDISGTTRTYAGGGGAGSYLNVSGGAGGAGGGGGGASSGSGAGGLGGTGGTNNGATGGAGSNSNGGAGGANTGSGGGGGAWTSGVGGTGGSGVVVVRYTGNAADAMALGSAVTTVGGDTVITFNQSGSFTTYSASTPSTLTLNAGNVTFGGAIGNINALGGLTVTGTAINVPGNINTINGPIALNGALNLTGNSVMSAGTGTNSFGGTVNGAFNLTSTAATITFGGAVGGVTPLNNVSVTATNGMTLPAINAATVLARTTGATADITLGGNITASANSGTSITLAAARDLDNTGSHSLNLAGTARWLVYSGDAADATVTKGGLTGTFNRYNCTYTGGCTAPVTIPASGNGFIYVFQPSSVINSVVANNKIYDGTATATLDVSGAFITGLLPGDLPNLLYGGATIVFDDKNAGTGKTVTVTNLLDDVGYAYTTNPLTANITPRTLNVTYTGVNKVYDGSATASVTTADDRVGGDVLTINRSAAFPDKNVGTGLTVSVTGVNLTGTDSGNYNVAATGSATANITPRVLSVIYTGVNRVYDGTGAATVTTADDRVGGDVLTINRAAAFPDKNVGTGLTVSVTGVNLTGTDGGNYSVAATGSTAANITQRALVITATGINKLYDGNATATVTLADNRVVGDLLTTGYGTANFPDDSLGNNRVVTVTGITLTGADNGNYTFNTTATTLASILSTLTPPPATTPASTLPNTVVKVSQDPSNTMIVSDNDDGIYATPNKGYLLNWLPANDNVTLDGTYDADEEKRLRQSRIDSI